VLKDEDWLLADRWARAERAEGVLTRSLAGEEPERTQLTDRWARMGMVADFRQARLESGLAEALEVLREGGVRSMLLKGAALAVTAYEGGFPDRPMEDVDVLVPDAEASAAYELLRNAGWIADGASTGAELRAGRAG